MPARTAFSNWRCCLLVIIVVGSNLCKASSARAIDVNMKQLANKVYSGNCWTVLNHEEVLQIRNDVVFRSDPRTQITTLEKESRTGIFAEVDFCGVLLSARLQSISALNSDPRRIFFDVKRSLISWLEGDHIVSVNAENSITKQLLSERAVTLNAQLVAKMGPLILLEQRSADSVALIAYIDSQLFHLAQCQECAWAVGSDLGSIYSLSVRDLVIHSTFSLDDLIVARVQYARKTSGDAFSKDKRAVVTAVHGIESLFDTCQRRLRFGVTPVNSLANGETPEDEKGYLWTCLSLSVGVLCSVLLVMLCVDKTKPASSKKKSKVSKSSDSPGKHSNESDSNIASVDFSLSRKDLISSREGVTSDFELRPASPRRVYFPIDASQSGPATVAVGPMPQTVYSHFLPPGARSRMNVPFEDIKYVTEIGSGNFGKVYLAKWQALKVAVKVTADDNAAKFGKELSLMLHLTPHPNVVQILGFSNDGFHPLIMMEYCRGGSLSEQIKDPQVAFPIARVVRILFGVARGMLHLHKSNIVHRDLAARNVLLTKDGEPKLSDFGFSRLLKNTQGRSRTLLGPLCWMSPEALQTGTYSTKLDVWSFGCLIYELVARKEPHEGADLLAIGPKIRDEHLTPFVDDLTCESAVLMTLMKQCWCVDPDARPDFQAICDTLEKELSIYEPDTIVFA